VTSVLAKRGGRREHHKGYTPPAPPRIRLSPRQQFDLWLKRATTGTVKAVRRFATGLRHDYEAVKSGVTLAVVSGGPLAERGGMGKQGQ
jgi:hypothetical protein